MSLHKHKILLEAFHTQKILSSYDELLQDKIELGQKQLSRLLDEFEISFDNIIKYKKDKKNYYELNRPIDLFVEAFDNSEKIGWIYNLAHEGDPDTFKELERFTKQTDKIYLFKNSPFEDTKSIESNTIFQTLKKNIQAREYTKIQFFYDDTIYDNLKPIKLVFIDNNWYIAYIDNEDKLKFGRISFIQKVNFGSKENHFQPSSIQKHLEFLDNHLQNSLTLYGVDKQTATIKANPNIAKYFKKDMKKFLSSQTFQDELEDGSIIFTVEYTQPLEILPFIQKWLPDLIILEPKELKEAYISKLKDTLKNHKN